MPIYDRICPRCGWEREDCYESVTIGSVLCPNGHETERGRIIGGRAPALVDDSWPGGRTFENLGDKPVTCYSRSEFKRELEARGLREFVRHAPEAGTDKSPFTTNWSSMSQVTLDEAKKLLERVG